jgi:hypothetical protein
VSEEQKKQQFTDLVPPPPESAYKNIDKADEPITGDTLVEVGSDFMKQISTEMGRVGFENLKQLCLQNEYEIAGKKYIGKKLTPKNLKEIRQLEKDFTEQTKTMQDNLLLEDANLAILKSKAYIHLGMTPDEFEETDVPLLQQIVTARDLRLRGWFRLQ